MRSLDYIQLFFEDDFAILEELDGESVKQILLIMRDYARDGITPDMSNLDAGVRVAWRVLKNRVDLTASRVETNRNNRLGKTKNNEPERITTNDNELERTGTDIKETAYTETDTDTDTETDIKKKTPTASKKKRERFSPPTPEEVNAYAKENGLNVDGEEFCDLYASKGWKVGRDPMVDWKASARNWARKEWRQPSQRSAPAKVVQEQKYDQPPNMEHTAAARPEWMDRYAGDLMAGDTS